MRLFILVLYISIIYNISAQSVVILEEVNKTGPENFQISIYVLHDGQMHSFYNSAESREENLKKIIELKDLTSSSDLIDKTELESEDFDFVDYYIDFSFTWMIFDINDSLVDIDHIGKELILMKGEYYLAFGIIGAKPLAPYSFDIIFEESKYAVSIILELDEITLEDIPEVYLLLEN